MAEQQQGSAIGIGVVGLGFIGGTHIRAYQAAAKAGYACRLIAVCDESPALLKGEPAAGGNIRAGDAPARLFDPSLVRGCREFNDLLNDPAIRLVSVCTYTDSHVDLSIRALEAGKHVLVEKPVANTAAEVERLAAAARASQRWCMPAMCMRFWPGWDWLHGRIADRTFGAVRSASFQRLGSQPAWGKEFYGDYARSGGALLDLHIHDVDFIHWCFGPPEEARAAGTLSHVTTQYRCTGGPEHLTAEAAWDLTPLAGFRMRFLVNFEKATAEFDSSRTPSLMLHDSQGSRAVEISRLAGYDGEIRHLLDVIAGRCDRLSVTLEDAVSVMRTMEAERKSLESARRAL